MHFSFMYVCVLKPYKRRKHVKSEQVGIEECATAMFENVAILWVIAGLHLWDTGGSQTVTLK